jgi:hypothetical protein
MTRYAGSLAATAMLAAALAISNQAHAGSGDVAAGLFSGLVTGAIVGSALAPRAPEPVYVAPAPYYSPPQVCFAHRQVFDPYYRIYRWQRVLVPCY